jgi:hypothetical protein
VPTEKANIAIIGIQIFFIISLKLVLVGPLW